MDPPDFHPLSKYYHHISSYNAQIIKSYSIGSITIFIIQSRLTFIALTFVQLKTVSLVHQISSYPISKRSLQEKTSTRRWIKFFVKPKTSHGKLAFIRSTGQFVLLVSGNFQELHESATFLIFCRRCFFARTPRAITSPVNRDSLTIYQAGKRSHASVRRLTHEVLVWEELRSTGPFFLL